MYITFYTIQYYTILYYYTKLYYTTILLLSQFTVLLSRLCLGKVLRTKPWQKIWDNPIYTIPYFYTIVYYTTILSQPSVSVSRLSVSGRYWGPNPDRNLRQSYVYYTILLYCTIPIYCLAVSSQCLGKVLRTKPWQKSETGLSILYYTILLYYSILYYNTIWT
jgi:hypothetical protein